MKTVYRRKYKRSDTSLPADWQQYETATVNGRHLEPGTEVKIQGERGRFRFMHRVTRDSGVEWLTFWGGAKGCEAYRSFRPERIKTVHRMKLTPKALMEARKNDK